MTYNPDTNPLTAPTGALDPGGVVVGLNVDSGGNLKVTGGGGGGGGGAVTAISGAFVSDSIVDLFTLLGLAGTSADANTVNSVMGRLTKIRDLLNSTMQMSQSDVSVTGTISAAQPVINTPVASSTVVLALGQGQSSWEANLSNGGGGFTSGTTIVADISPDSGTTWYAKSFKVSGVSPVTSQSTVVGPGPLKITGNCASASQIRIRCSVLNSTETIVITLRAGTGIGEVSLIAGGNLIGGVNLVDSAGTNKQSINAAGQAQTEDIEQAGYTAGSSPPTATNAGSDTSYTFASQVSRIIMQNNTSANVYYAFDVAATLGSLVLLPGGFLSYPKKCTVLHLYTVAAQNINGTAVGSIVVLGAN